MAGELFCIFDPGQGRFLQVNPAFVRLLGYSEEQLLSRHYTEFVHPADRGNSDAAAGQAHAGIPVHEFVNRYVCADGSLRWLEWTTVSDESGHTFCVARDVTARRRAEAALQQAFDDLRLRNRELQDFAFVASHDLQEPLRKIRAFSDRLLARYSAALDEQGRDYLVRSGQAAARMQVLIDDLLAYSRVNSRGKPFGEVDLGQVVGSVLDDLEARLEASGGAVEVGTLPRIQADATQLRQMLQNLIANALKFRAPDRAPLVRIHAEQRQLEGERPGWAVIIEDNGIGFEQKYAERIFGPFQRLHGRQEYEGTGIGLAIVRRIVERHRGTVEAEGRPGEGARFVVILPERQAGSPLDAGGVLQAGS
jgi:PAS domain S-box-containing protein